MLPQEAAEFPKVLKWYEDVCTKKFGAVRIMMMKDFFVHYHAFPRYDKTVHFFGTDWNDKDYPGSFDFKEGVILDENKIQEIKKYMKKIKKI